MDAAVHISLKVSELERSVDFYRKLLGEPSKLHPDYAKFVSRDPEIHLALSPGLGQARGGGPLSHLGIRVGSTAEVLRRRAELTERGLRTEMEMGTDCCHARQDKFWVTDPDGNRWEVYTVLRDLQDESAAPAARRATCC